MGNAYSTFTSTPAALVADLRNAILASSDWGQINPSTLPNVLTCTTTRGNQIVIDLADASPTVQVARFGLFRSHNGTVGVDKVQKALWYKRVVSGALDTVNLHVTVSCSKEHLYIQIEGPRGGVNFADNASWGSFRSCFWVCDLIPYFPTEDTVPVLVTGANHATVAFDGNIDDKVYTYSASQAWRTAILGTEAPACPQAAGLNRYGFDGDLYFGPYVVHEQRAGMRGRLNRLFHCGYNYYDDVSTPIPPVGSEQDYEGQPFRVLAPYKTDGSQSANVGGPLGYITNNNGITQFQRSVLIAVPSNNG